MTRLTPKQQAMVTDNLGLIHFTINQYYRHLADDPDSYQDGVLGLIRAARDFNPAKARFSTYAVIWIRREVGRGRDTRMGLNYRHARYAGHDYQPPLSLDQLITVDDGDSTTLADYLPAAGPQPHDEIEDRALVAVTTRVLVHHARDEIDRDVISRLFDRLNDQRPDSRKAIGDRHGLTAEGVRQREVRLTARVRTALTSGAST